ncbi:MAG: molecular chaperone DnaK (HSP70) [bacterium]|jgi:molecular chaperone DnaK (HSP70)
MNSLQSRFLVSIDLGTSNSAVFYVDQEALTQELTHFSISQWIGDQEVFPQSGLSSHTYILSPEELESKRYQLGWEDKPQPYIVGDWARQQQIKKPGRNISSVKSWLCYHQVDPNSPFLPQSDLAELPHYSPVEVTSFYLSHIKQAWNAQWKTDDGKNNLEHQNLVITIPASFDDTAREYTLQAIQKAGLENVTLLEEPQAAFYSWIASQNIDDILSYTEPKTVVVIDIGGGTSDFSLVRISVEEKEGKKHPKFERIAVSEHILLGGDNIDLTLAANVEKEFVAEGKKLAPRQWESLVSQCRLAKEVILAGEQDSYTITVAKTGSRLIGGTKSTKINFDTIQKIILDGFFPLISWNEPIVRNRSHGLRKMGLPYAQEPAITKHLCSFLKRYIEEHSDLDAFPNQILFNGGTISPKILQDRLQQQVEQWKQELNQSKNIEENQSIELLQSVGMDLAVARGGAYYHLAKKGLGLQISGGSARSYYISITTQDKETKQDKEDWLCVLPQQAGVETSIAITTIDFLLRINQAVQFKLISTIHRHQDQIGEILELNAQEIEENFISLPPVQSFINIDRRNLKKGTQDIQVQLKAKLNEIGTLSVFCVSKEREQKWKLDFRLKKDQSSQDEQILEIPDSAIPDKWKNALSSIQEYYGKTAKKQEKSRPFSIYKHLEKELGSSRKEWDIILLRKMADLLYEGMSYKVRSPFHEQNWLKLLGFSLRPGFGFPQDERRIQQIEDLFKNGPYFKNERNLEIEWWILCRRVAGGLPTSTQQVILEQLKKRLQSGSSKRRPSVSGKNKKGQVKKSDPTALNELWRLLASLENIPAKEKIQLGDNLIKQITAEKFSGSEGWCLARLGNREPFYGDSIYTIPIETVEKWISWVLKLKDIPFQNEIPLILTQLGQYTGDRQRDIQDHLRQEILTFLKKEENTEHLQKILMEGKQEQSKEDNQNSMSEWLLGDSIPSGLRTI